MENSASQSPHSAPRSGHFGGDSGFPALSAVLTNHDFHTFADSPSAGDLLRGLAAGVATSPDELMEAAMHQSSRLPVKFPSARTESKKMGLSLGLALIVATSALAAGGVFPRRPEKSGSAEEHGLRGRIMMPLFAAAFIPGVLGVVFGGRALVRASAGPARRSAESRKILERELGKQLEELPVFFVGERQLPSDERMLLPQLCGFYNLLQLRGHPIPVDEWKSITGAALEAVHHHRLTGDLTLARQVGETIDKWLANSEQALHSPTEIFTPGTTPSVR